MITVKVRSAPPPVRPARSAGALYAKFDQEAPTMKPQHPFVAPEFQKEDSESDTEHCFENYASDYEEAVDAGDTASEGNGSGVGDPDEAMDEEGDAYDCEYYELPCTKPRLSMFRHRSGHQRPHIPCPRLVEEEYLEE